ncbi:MAG: Gfo/Idh/MocA family oxidoreductase [Succinivibrio sp.]|nr:Gfo/Idh/MocA family oxidoreductase [Succinivibrio sp.]
MSKLKILFVGLGSIGQRHLRNLREILKRRDDTGSIYALRSLPLRELPSEAEAALDGQFSSYDELPRDFTHIFITNPTSYHYKTLLRLLPCAPCFFVEKPLFELPDFTLPDLKDKVVYTACPLRYTALLRRMQEYVSSHRVIAARAICSSYLPAWRPQSDYRQSYSARKELGGGVALDLIHEWDYLTWLFGMPLDLKSYRAKLSDLDIDTEDCAVYIARYADKLVSLHLDYFGRRARRELELYTDSEVVRGDFITGEIQHSDGTVISVKEDRDVSQRAELEYFLSLKPGLPNANPPELALEVLRLTLGRPLKAEAACSGPDPDCACAAATDNSPTGQSPHQ